MSKGNAEYAIFDLDGLLVLQSQYSDTEKIMSVVTNTILGRYGYEMTWEIKSGLMGKPQRQATEYLYSHCPGLEDKLPIDDFLVERNRMQDEQFATAPPMPGAVALIKSLHKAGVPIAVATGSSRRNYEIKTAHLTEMMSLFPVDCILTADSPEVQPGRGKPNPDIFLAAAQKLGRDVGTAFECTEAQRLERAKGLVFEDARPGVQAGVAAGMNVIWVPDAELRALDPTEDYGSKQVLRSLEEWKGSDWGLELDV